VISKTYWLFPVCLLAIASAAIQEAGKQQSSNQETDKQQSASPAESSPSLAEIRKSAADAFLGSGAYDETSRLTLAERPAEEVFDAGCVGAQNLRDSALKAFEAAGFEEIDTRLKYPELSLHMVRRRAAPPLMDVLLFYFKIEKSGGVDCRFTLGDFARTENSRQKAVQGNERDQLVRDIKQIVASLTTAITSRQQVAR